MSSNTEISVHRYNSLQQVQAQEHSNDPNIRDCVETHILIERSWILHTDQILDLSDTPRSAYIPHIELLSEETESPNLLDRYVRIRESIRSYVVCLSISYGDPG